MYSPDQRTLPPPLQPVNENKSCSFPFIRPKNRDFGSMDNMKRVSRLQQLEFQVGRKVKKMLSLQTIQVAVEGMVAIRVKCNRSQVQGSSFRVKDKESIKYPGSSLKIVHFPN